ncbi:MAG: EamA family transporter [Planctomycetota bacterium]
MSPLAIGLILISACTHAGWNLLARQQRSEMAFFIRMLTLIIVTGFLPVVISETLVRSLPAKAWFCLAGSGLCGGVYLYSLAMAYGSADFTIVYPAARALPVLLVALGDVLRGRFLTLPGWLGLTLVAAGCFLTPLRSFGEFSVHRYFHRSVLWMLLAASGTVGYSLLDKVASEVVLAGPATAGRYCYVFFFSSGVVLLLLRWMTNSKGCQASSVGWTGPVIGAVCFFGSYWLVLWAYQLGRHASYVVAFRQFSIVIGVVIAFVIYKERGVAVRILATVLITVGLILVGLLGNS